MPHTVMQHPVMPHTVTHTPETPHLPVSPHESFPRSLRARVARCHARVLWHEEHGQATTEYALVMLGAALVALLVVGWATSGGAGGKIGRLFDKVVDAVIDKL